MKKATVVKNIVIYIIIFLGFSIGILMLTHRRPEYISQKASLEAYSNIPVSKIESVYLWWMWGNRTAELDHNRDKTDIKKLMSVIKKDLWFSRWEINPYGDEPPAYDEVRIHMNDGKTRIMLCWLGNEGGKNPSLNIRSRTGEFKRVVQDIIKRKGKP
ncbi:hypothetical protein LLG46_14935 [bacterium]|nr:hypothetical protein [bacterium]